MIKKHLEQEVLRLLEMGNLSHRKIARLTGVSRGTVGSIASGRRKIISEKYLDSLDSEESIFYLYPPKLCLGCGYKVYLPCRICAARAAAAKSKKIKIDETRIAPGPMVLGLNLKPAHQERYEEVRRWRRESGFVG